MAEPVTGQDEFWSSAPSDPGGESDVRGGRYHLADPETGLPATWTRASNVGAVLADRFGLERWARRRLLRGLGERPDLLDLLRAMVDYDDAKLDEVAETASQVAATTEAANLGTMIHEVQLRVDRGLPVPEGMERYAEGYRSCLERHGLVAVVREARVINRGLGAAGRTDGIYRESDGTLVVGDTKSTGHMELAAPETAPQLAAYATAQWIELNGDGKGWTRMGPVRTDYAVAFHVDRETGATAPYRVDLFLGAYGANLAGQVREYRKMRRSILAPYVRPEGQPEARRTPPVAQENRHLATVPDPAPSAEQPVRVHDQVNFLKAVKAEVDQGSAAHVAQMEAMAGVQDPGTVAASGGPEWTPEWLSAAELTRLTKAQVQAYARKVDPEGVGRDLAHQKAVLVTMLGKAGKIASPDGGPPIQPATTEAAEPAMPPSRPSFKDPAEIAGPINGSDPTDPRDPAFRDSVMRRLAAAASVAELGTIHTYVVRRGGDQAWTDEMAGVARVRANELDAASPNHAVLSRIVACRSQEDVARLWDELTVGGSRPEGWPQEVDAAARERMRQIEAATPPAPSNPFGPGTNR